jgi:hypothetical protein
MVFPARPLSLGMWISTAFVVLCVALGLAAGLWGAPALWVQLLIGLTPLVLLWPLRDSPRVFRVDGARVTIVGRLGTAAVLDVAEVVDAAPTLAVRWAGSSGFLGYSGWFGLRGGGTARVYATTPDALVLLRTRDGRAVVVSPEDREGFVRAVRRGLAPEG